MTTKAPQSIIDYDSPEYKRSRKAYIAQCTLEYFVSILAADVFLARLLTSIGISDSLNGIISSFITLAFVFQLFSIFLINGIKNTKRTMLIFDTLSQLFFLAVFLVPFLPFSANVKTAIVIISILIAYLLKYLINSIFFKWCNSYVSPSKRGEYSAVKEMVSLFAGIVFTLAVGFIIDKFDAVGNMEGSFLFIAIIMLVLNICNFICICMIKNEKVEVHQYSLKTILKKTLGNKNFVNIIIMTSLFDIGRYMSIGFFGVYKTSTLFISIGTVQIINMAANLIRLIISKPFGKYSDKTSYAHGFKLAMILAAVGFGVNAFTTPVTRWLIIAFTVFYFASMAGTNQNGFNITYSYVDIDFIVPAMAIKNSIAGLLGFCASLVGGHILSLIQANGDMLFGLKIYGQQLLSVISCVIIIAAILFNKLVVEKQEIIRQ